MRDAAWRGAQERGVWVRARSRAVLEAERCWSRRVVRGVGGAEVDRVERGAKGTEGRSLEDHLVRVARRVGRKVESWVFI